MDVVSLNGGFGHTRVIDLSAAGGTEILLPVSMRLMGASSAAALNLAFVR